MWQRILKEVAKIERVSSRTGGIEGLLRQGTIEEVAKIERVSSKTGGREELLRQGTIEEVAKMRECPAEQVAESGF